MTRLEFDSYFERKCPCGLGQITKHVTSTDYRYDVPSIRYTLDCASCATRWREDHGSLVERSSELPYAAAQLRHAEARKQLTALASEITRAHFANLTFKSKKAELAFLIEHNLSDARYAAYLKERSSGRAVHEIAFGLRNPTWLLAVTASLEVREQLSLLLAQDRQAAEDAAIAAKQVVRRSMRRA